MLTDIHKFYIASINYIYIQYILYMYILYYIQYKDAPVPGTMWHTLPEEIMIALITNMHACKELSLSSSGRPDAMGFDLTSDKSNKRQRQLKSFESLTYSILFYLVIAYFHNSCCPSLQRKDSSSRESANLPSGGVQWGSASWCSLGDGGAYSKFRTAGPK